MKIGDKVRFLSEVGGGIVKGFQGKDIVLVEDTDGFDIPMHICPPAPFQTRGTLLPSWHLTDNQELAIRTRFLLDFFIF